MKSSEWLLVCNRVAALWPNNAWAPNTAAAAYSLFERISSRAATAAVDQLAAQGREFAPPPGAVYEHAAAIERDLVPALPDIDLVRDLTPEEEERARRRGRELVQKIRDLAASRALKT